MIREGILRHLDGQVSGDLVPGDDRVRVVDADGRVLDAVGDHGDLVLAGCSDVDFGPVLPPGPVPPAVLVLLPARTPRQALRLGHVPIVEGDQTFDRASHEPPVVASPAERVPLQRQRVERGAHAEVVWRILIRHAVSLQVDRAEMVQLGEWGHVAHVVERRVQLAQLHQRADAREILEAAPRDPEHLEPLERAAERASRRHDAAAEAESGERGHGAADATEVIARRVGPDLQVRARREVVGARQLGEAILREPEIPVGRPVGAPGYVEARRV